MIKKHTIFFTLIILFAACGKKAKLNKTSGVYEVYKFEQVYYNLDGGVDSVVTIENFGTIGLAYNDSDIYNNTYLDWQFNPTSWTNTGVGVSLPVGWYVDNIDGKSLTFFSEDEYFSYFVIFTINEKAGKKAEWTTVIPNSQGGIGIKETIYVKKQ